MKQRKMKKEKVENCLIKKECKLKHSIYIITFLQPPMNVLITINWSNICIKSVELHRTASFSYDGKRGAW